MVPPMSRSRFALAPHSMTAVLVTIAIGASCSRAPLLDGPGARPADDPEGGDTAPRCGDGVVDPGEGCDDGNDSNGDGCDATCQPTACGNGIIDRGEECDEGSANRDSPALRIEHGDLRIPVLPVTAAPSIDGFYDYFSKSSHTGFEDLGVSRIYLYFGKDTQRLGLIMHHGIDLDTSGITQPESTVDMFLESVPESAFISVVDDDPDEFFSDGFGFVVGRWWFASNSDGGALDALPFPGNWRFTVDTSFDGGVDTWTFADGEGYVGNAQQLPLDPSETLTIIADDEPATCRPDCTLPKCGDGVLDGGEVCDDRGAGSCSGDCQAVI